MRDLLFLAHRMPYPPDKGDKIRAWHVLQHLARNHRIHLGCFVDDPDDRQHLPALAAACADLCCIPLDPRRQRLKALATLRPGLPLSFGYFRDRRLQRWVDAKLAAGIDRAYVFCSAMAPYLMDADATHRVLDMVDVDSEKFASYAASATGPMRAVWAREARTLLAYERRAALRFDRTLLVSEHEWQRFVTLAPECLPRTFWFGNGVDLAEFSPDTRHDSPFEPGFADIVFTGRMDYRPNIDAVEWFVRDVFPLLRRQAPRARFWIVGAAPSAEVLALAKADGVRVTGRVADTRPYLAHAAVAVAPLRQAHGIQNKVLEAMAMARPVVASPEAFEGIRAQPGRDILLASGVEQTVRLIGEVLEGRHDALGPAARRAVEAGHRWSETLRPLDALFGDTPAAGLLTTGPGTTGPGTTGPVATGPVATGPVAAGPGAAPLEKAFLA